MRISFIAAMAENRVVGVENRLPWSLPEDLKHFRKLTTGHPVIMGRKTYESIGRPLPNRENVVITRQKSWHVPGVRVAGSIEEALEPYRLTDQEVFVIGGGEIWRQSIKYADRLYLTIVHKNYEGDAYFPDIDGQEFLERERSVRHEDPSGLCYTFLVLERPVRSAQGV